MLCCPECFHSKALKEIIIEQGKTANCEACGSTDQSCLPIQKLAQKFKTLIAFYRKYPGPEPYSGLGRIHGIDGNSLAEVMERDGLQIFSKKITTDQKNALLDVILNDPEKPASGWWYSAVIGLSTIEPPQWTEFTVKVKFNRRYNIHWDKWDLRSLLKTSNPCFTEIIPTGTMLFRARRHDTEKVYAIPSTEFLGPPPPDNATAGRANASGIQVLYISDSFQTAIAETRPFVGGVVSIAECVPLRDLKIFNLSSEPKLEKLDSFGNGFIKEMEMAALAAALNKEFAEPVAPFTAERDYAPTQIVAEIIWDNGYDGIKYRSAMSPTGHNYVIFYPHLFKIKYHSSVRVKGVEVKTESYDPQWLNKTMASLLKPPSKR